MDGRVGVSLSCSPSLEGYIYVVARDGWMGAALLENIRYATATIHRRGGHCVLIALAVKDRLQCPLGKEWLLMLFFF